MPSLHELQRGVMRALLDAESDGATSFITAQGVAAAQALSVYANNALSNFIESVLSSYPAIRRLVGDDYIRQCARRFHICHPSLSGDLQPAGTRFAQYLFELHGADEYRYLSEVARLEWLIQETLLSADHEPLDLAKLRGVAPAGYDDVRFYLHPSARLFASEFPCLAIWEANVGNEAEPEVIDLRAGADRVVLVRNSGQLRFHRLSHGEQRFLQFIQAGEPFSAAVEIAASHEPDTARTGLDAASGISGAAGHGFDPAAALQRFVFAGVIVDFR